MRIEPNSTLLMIGDSITDCGRGKPYGFAPNLGTGYVNFVDALLGAAYPERRIRVINMGIGGNTVRDLQHRWQTDVINLEPDWLSIMIGINDVWRQFDRPLHTKYHISPGCYESTLRELVETARPGLKGLVLMTPFFIESHAGDPMRARMDEYGAIVKRIAADTDALFVDTQTAFAAGLQVFHPAAYAGDRVHPNPTGHMILARAFLEAIGFRWEGDA